MIALNAGYRVRPAVRVGDLEIDDEIRVGLGTEVPLRRAGLAITGELVAGIGLGASDDVFSGRQTPVELLAGLRWRTSVGLTTSLAAGAGLSIGYGAPDYRLLLSVTYGLEGPSDTPEPWVVDHETKAKEVVLSHPDPWPPAPLMDDSTFDQVLAADKDADGDGVLIDADKCPTEPEDVDGFQDDDGCPELDNDADGIADAEDKCPTEKETINGVDDDDGCPDTGGTELVAKGDEKIVIKERIEFTSGGAKISDDSLNTLRQVAVVVKANRHIPRFRVEGHTDNLGNAEFNVALSNRRAEQVRRFLIDLGVDGDRLEVKGYGPSKPIASNGTARGRAKNRRVEFFMVDQAELDERKKAKEEEEARKRQEETEAPQNDAEGAP